MKCDVCGAELANSEELKAHREREHTLEELGDDELEAPDFSEEKAREATPIGRGQG